MTNKTNASAELRQRIEEISRITDRSPEDVEISDNLLDCPSREEQRAKIKQDILVVLEDLSEKRDALKATLAPEEWGIYHTWLEKGEIGLIDIIEFGALKEKYEKTMAVLKAFDLVKQEGDSYSYKADYDGYYEKVRTGPNGETKKGGKNFEGASICLLTFNEMLARIKPAHVKAYAELKRKGLEPKLQITPIGYKLRTLADKFSAKVKNLGYKGVVRIFEFNDVKLNYPSKCESGELTKSEWIDENNGFLVDIVPTNIQERKLYESEWLHESDEFLYSVPTNIQDVNKLAINAFKDEVPLTCETYLVSEMTEVKDANRADGKYKSGPVSYFMLPDFGAVGEWVDDSRGSLSLRRFLHGKEYTFYDKACHYSEYIQRRCRTSIRIQ